MCSSISISSIIFLLFLMPNIVIPTTTSDKKVNTSSFNSTLMIERACSEPRLNRTGLKSNCTKLLLSQPNIKSAPDSYNLSIAIMQSGISSANATWKHIKSSLKKKIKRKTGLNGALQCCDSSYDSVIVSFRSALNEVINDKEYQTATYDLQIGSMDDIQPCMDEVASKNLSDNIISKGNNLVRIYGFSAYQAVVILQLNSTTPPPGFG